MRQQLMQEITTKLHSLDADSLLQIKALLRNWTGNKVLIQAYLQERLEQ